MAPIDATPGRSVGEDASAMAPDDTSRSGPAMRTADLRQIALTLIVVSVALVAWMVWHHRMIIDDGLIHLRVVQQIRSGNGPVFNIGQRVEVSSSPAWVWLLSMLDLILPARLDHLAFGAGLAATCGAVTAPLWGRVVPAPAERGYVVLPAAIVILALSSPFAAWASGALEGGLIYLWLATCWVGALRMATARTFDPRFGLLIGCGPLVRQEFVVLAVAMLIVIVHLSTGLRSKRALVAIAGSLAPTMLYQVFRMTYYGKLVPNPTIAKNVGEVRLGRGWDWLAWALTTNGLIVPLVAVAALSVWWLIGADRSERLVWLTFVLGSVSSLSVIVAAGGDFLGSRLIQPTYFALALPVLFIAVPDADARPRREGSGGAAAADLRFRRGAIVLACLAGSMTWRLVGPPATVAEGAMSGYTTDVRTAEATFIGSNALPALWPTPRLFGRKSEPMPGVVTDQTEVYELAIGLRSIVQVPAVQVIDALTLADPLGAHLQPRGNGGFRIVGHEKLVPVSWELARAADVSNYRVAAYAHTNVAKAYTTVAATKWEYLERDTKRMRTLLSECQPLKDISDAANEPLTAKRAWSNLLGAASRTRRRFDGDPARVRREYCPEVRFEDE